MQLSHQGSSSPRPPSQPSAKVPHHVLDRPKHGSPGQHGISRPPLSRMGSADHSPGPRLRFRRRVALGPSAPPGRVGPAARRGGGRPGRRHIRRYPLGDEDHDHEALNTMPLFSPSQSLYQRRGAVLATVTMGDERQNNRGRCELRSSELYTNLGLFQPALQTPFSRTHMQTTDGPDLPFQHPPESRVNATNGIVPDEDLDISRSWHAVLCLVYYGRRERRAGSWRTFNEEGKQIGRTGGGFVCM